jgi:hypothetical protein
MRFASREWVDAVVAALNRHADLARAMSGMGKDLAVVVEADRPAWPRAVALYGKQEGGRIAVARILPDEDELLELEPAYVVRAPYRAWKALMQGGDAVQAALTGRVRVEGDLEMLVRRSSYRYVIDAALAAVPTEFPDDGR